VKVKSWRRETGRGEKVRKKKCIFLFDFKETKLDSHMTFKSDVKFSVDTFIYKKHFHRRPYATRKAVLPKHDASLQNK
jgi:hypothetical protein